MRRILLRLGTVLFFLSLNAACGGPEAMSEGDEHEHHDDDGHEHEGGFNLTQFNLVLEGEDLEGNACYLGILPPYNGTERQLSVQTNFDHDGYGAGVLSSSVNSARTEYNGSSNTGRILIQLASGSRNLRGASSYVVAWQHEDHTDRAYCRNLRMMR